MIRNKKDFPHLLNKEIKSILELKKEISKLVPNANIILYGSKVKGNFDKESDLDLLIIIPNLSKELKYKIIEISTEIELEYDVVFGLVIISEEKYKNSNLFKSSLYYKNIKKEGITV